MRSNCIVFAVLLYRRRRHKDPGCYLSWRRSWHGPWPHCLFVSHDKRHFVSFVPRAPIRWDELVGWRAPLRVLPLHLIVFRGRVKWGDRRP